MAFVHKFLHGKLPDIFKGYFQHRHDINEILSGERKLRLVIPSHRTEIGVNTVKVQGPKLYNNITNQIKINVSSKVFKRNVKRIFLPYPE